MSLDKYSLRMLPAVENELKNAIDKISEPGLRQLRAMLAYHLGWEGEGAGPAAGGKRLRPLLVLLTTAAAGGSWQSALPAAASVELIHNFSLIHDDIEDNSPLRRGRPTLWKKWGVAQAINSGDTMYSLAHLVLLDLAKTASPGIALEAAGILQETCLRLTQGQFLDMSYEGQFDLTETDYWPMIEGKTSALISACSELGAITAGTNRDTRLAYCQFGRSLGLAFQVQDDILGIWGDAGRTGKSTASDLVSGKKSLPVLFGLGRKDKFAERWLRGSINPNEVVHLAQQLEEEGARAFAETASNRLINDALKSLEQAAPQGDAGQALIELTANLLNRKA